MTIKNESASTQRFFTVANFLSLLRLVGSVVLIPVAINSDREIFLGLFLFLAITDWLDGKIAVLFDQRTEIGARLDSWADAALYSALVFAVLWLYTDVMIENLVWLLLPVASYAGSTLFGFYKYGRWPSYHTRAAKTSWLFTLAAVVSLFLDWSLMPFYIASAAVTLTNLEALAITAISPRWRADVASVVQAWQHKRAQD